MPQNAGEKPTSKNRKGRANNPPSVGKTVASHRLTVQNKVNISTHTFQKSACTQQFLPTESTQPCAQQVQSTQYPQSTQPYTQQFQSAQYAQSTQPYTQQLQSTQYPQSTQPGAQSVQSTQYPQFTQPCTQLFQPTQSLQSTLHPTQQFRPTQFLQFTQPRTQQLQPTQSQLIQPPFPQPQLHQLCQTAQPSLDSVLTAEENLNTPSRPKPSPGVFAFGLLSFLDKKVSRCYGCQEFLKPGGKIPCPPEDMVVTTRLCRRYYDKDGQPKVSPKISSVYFHINPTCVRAACPQFESKSCIVPTDLIPFMGVQHSNALSERFGLSTGTRY